MAARGRGKLPAPLVGSEVNLNGYGFMPLLVARFLGSEFFALATLEERAVGMTLWFQSWHQQPAGSLPSDDKHLAYLAHCDAQKWVIVKAMALHKWVKCSDERLYHPVIAHEVCKAWAYRLEHEQKKSKNAERQRQWRSRNRDSNVTDMSRVTSQSH